MGGRGSGEALVNQQALIGEAPSDVGDDADFWPTPEYVVGAIVPVIKERLELGGRGRPHLLDPGCGSGVILDVVSSAVECCSLTGIEIHERRAKQAHRRMCGSASIVVSDFLADDFLPWWHQDLDAARPVLVPMNPPYSRPRQSIGLEFVEQAIRCAEPSGGLVAALLPLDYACAKERTERIHDKWRSGLFPLKNRPRFANGQTGKRPVAWFVFDLLNPFSEWHVLNV
jgi:predicted RNA methylase